MFFAVPCAPVATNGDQGDSTIMTIIEKRVPAAIRFRWLLVSFVASAAFMAVFRDVRTPLDGSSYSTSVLSLAQGNYDNVFRWSHVLHVPVLYVGYRLLCTVAHVDVLSYYQALDILLGAAGLCLLYRLVYRTTRALGPSILSCLLVMVSWVFWEESVTADEKMMGFVLVLLFLNLLQHFLDDARRDVRVTSRWRVMVLAIVLSASILAHASSILVIPACAYLVSQRRVVRFGLATAAVTAVLVIAVYVVILNLMKVSSVDGVIAYFSLGLNRYSIAATGVSATAWVRQLGQGVTKLTWAVFAEDGMTTALILAGVNLLFMGGLLLMMWRHRRLQQLRWLAIMFVTALIFGAIYAPDAPDSYFLLLIPSAAFFAMLLREPRFRVFSLGVFGMLLLNNGAHYLNYSAFRDNGADRRYQEAISGRLSASDRLIILDTATSSSKGTQALVPIHVYFNSLVGYIPSSRFLADPTAAEFIALARRHQLFIEGICFEEFANRAATDIHDSAKYGDLMATYDLEVAVPFTDYSSMYHRAYKNVHRLIPKSSS
jgi:hypothetical protein